MGHDPYRLLPDEYDENESQFSLEKDISELEEGDTYVKEVRIEGKKFYAEHVVDNIEEDNGAISVSSSLSEESLERNQEMFEEDLEWDDTEEEYNWV